MSTAKRLHYSYDEFQRLLGRSDIKLEYCDGVIYAMAGGTLAHSQLAGAAIATLRQALRTRCSVFTLLRSAGTKMPREIGPGSAAHHCVLHRVRGTEKSYCAWG